MDAKGFLKKRHSLYIVLALAPGVMAILLVVHVPADAHADFPVTVCDLTENPGRYNGSVVEVEARFQTAGEHGEFLIDGKCLDKGIDVSHDDTDFDRGGIAQLIRQVHRSDALPAVLSQYPTAWATVVGVFHARQQAFRSPELRILEVRRIRLGNAPPLLPKLKPHLPAQSKRRFDPNPSYGDRNP